MNYGNNARNQLHQKFVNSHQPNKLFNLLHGFDGTAVFKVFTVPSHNWSAKERDTFDKMSQAIVESKHTPAKFFKVNYSKVVELCAGSKKEAELLYGYFDKLNQFSYPAGWERRTVRTRTYINSIAKIRLILFAAYHFQMYECSLSQYLLNDMSEELIDFKQHSGMDFSGLEDVIAAHLDANDTAVKDTITKIITSDNNGAFITTSIIRGIFKSNDKDLHKLLGNFLLAARLQEGMRQAVCENMDCGTIEAFRTIFDVIDEHDLLRYSAVRRAVATWIGIIDTEHLKRSSDKTFRLMHDVVKDQKAAYELINSDDAVKVLVGLWGLGFYEVADAVKVMEDIAVKGSVQQKRVAAFYNMCLANRPLQQRLANQFMESEGVDIELAAGLMETYMVDCQSEATLASGFKIGARVDSRPVNLYLWFGNEQQARKHYDILDALLQSMDHRKYQFDPYIFPWYSTRITYANILIRMCAIANGLKDEALMDQLSDRIPDLDGPDNSRVCALRLLFSGKLSQKRRSVLINTLGDKDSYTRKEALSIANKLEFTPDEYDKMCELLRFKAADLRVNIISLIKKQDSDGLERSIGILLNDKREEMRLAGLDIVRGLIQDTDENGEVRKDVSSAIDVGKSLAQAITAPTQREQIFINEIFGINSISNEDIESTDDDVLYDENDTIAIPSLTHDKTAYPLFKYTEAELNQMLIKFDSVVYEHRNYEFKNAGGATVLLGNHDFLPMMKYTGTLEEKIPLLSVWKEFYETEIKDKELLMAMYLALVPHGVQVEYNTAAILYHKYDQYVTSLCADIFGKGVLAFEPILNNTKKTIPKGKFGASAGLNILRSLLRVLVEIYCDYEYQNELGKKTAEYLCCKVPEDKRTLKVIANIGWQEKEIFISPLNSSLICAVMNSFAETWKNREEFAERFRVLLVIGDYFKKQEAPVHAMAWGYQLHDVFKLEAIDYVIAARFGMITEEQMYRIIFEEKWLRKNLHNLFIIYRVERFPHLKKQIEKYGLDDEELAQYVRQVANVVADTIVKVECKRGDSLTKYSEAVTAIECYYGLEHLVMLLIAMGKDKFARSDSFGWNTNGSRKVNLSHLISVCYPRPTDTVEMLKEALEKTSIDEKRLIEVVMYAPQWVDLIEEYLQIPGLKSGAYYFMAHMNDQYNRDQRKFATIARYTPLEKEELFNGAFDIAWFEDAYQTLGADKFQLLYDAAKYISDGSKHSRARKYADAVLGNVEIDEVEADVSEKRSKDLLMSYPLIPLKDKADILRRYEFIQKFRKESKQFGSQRQKSEGIACDMAMRNLATRAGFKDVTRLTLMMEMALAESLKSYFEWQPLEQGLGAYEMRIEVSLAGKPDLAVKKEGKLLATIPSAVKSSTYYLELKESLKKFREQYSRTVKMFEQSMEDRELFSVEEIIGLKRNPVVRPIIDNLIFASDTKDICGLVDTVGENGLVDSNKGFTSMLDTELIRVAHPFDLYKSGKWAAWQRVFYEKQQENGMKQPFRQVFRELYVKLNEEQGQLASRMFAGHQIQPMKTATVLKNRRWIADHESGLEKVFYKDNIVVTMYALADWFSPSEIEAPTLEYVAFFDRKTYKGLTIEEVPDIVYSEAMRDVDLAVSVAHAGNVDPEASHSTIEMRKVIMNCNIDLFGLDNVSVEGTHVFIKGSLGDYTVHLGSGVVHMAGMHQLNVLPVHSQQRGKIFLPFLDDDPKTAEIVSKVLLFANDKKIKDPYILEQMH